MSPQSPLRPGAAGPARRVPVALVAAVLLAACGGGTADEAAADGAETVAIQTYEVRGVVVRLLDPERPLAGITIRHVAIEDFVSIDGEVVGMDSMSMGFPVSEGVDLAGIEEGDPVAFTLEVEWDGQPPYRISRLAELPAGTGLDLGETEPPGA